MKITAEQKQKAKDVVNKHGLDFVAVFGSQANGKARVNSDLDICIMDYQAEELQRFKDLFNDFSNIFKGYNVDLRFIRGAEPVFLYQALSQAKFLAGDLMNFYNYRAFAYKRFVDSASLFKLKEKILKRRQKKLNGLYKNDK